MAITRVQTTKAGTPNVSQSSLTTANFGSNTTSGNLIVVVIRDTGANAISSVADTLGTTYTQHKQQAGGSGTTITIYSGVAGSTGTNAVTVTWAAGSIYRWVFAIEYAPGSNTWSSPFDTSAGGTGSSTGPGTLSASGTITTAQAEEVVVLGVSQSNAAATYTAGTDFTMIDGVIGSGGETFGGVEEYITSGTLSGYTGTVVTDVFAGEHALALVAFKTAAAGGGAKNLTLLGVG